MSFAPERREIFLFHCDTDGHPHSNPHYCIILSDNEYNQNSSSFLVIPITSQTVPPFRNFYIQTLGREDVSEWNTSNGESLRGYALCDNPCRVKKTSMKIYRKTGVMRLETFSKILEKAIDFIKRS